MIKIKPGLANLVPVMLLIAGICFLLNSCNKVEVDLGSDFVDNSTTNLAMVDSSTIEISTVYVDSFVTSGAGSILAGRYKDPQFGTIASNSFVQLGVPSGFSIPDKAVFDSLEIILKLNKTYYGDTLSPYKIAIHQLTDVITLPNEQFAFYNTSKCNYNSTPLGSNTVFIKPATADTISIRISQSLGQELFNKMFNKDGDVTDNAKFLDYFKGLAIIDGGGNNLMVGFKDSLTMRLHYLNPGVISTDAYVEFSISDNAKQFNNIKADRTGTPIAALGPANKQIFSPQSQNAGFSQYISGAMTKIRFPYLSSLMELSNFVKIIRADLVLKPVRNSFLSYYTLPPALRLSQTDQYNFPGPDLSAFSASGTQAIQYGNLFMDNLYGTQTAYTYDITSYLQQQIAITNINKNGLLVLPPNPSQIFNRVMIGDKQNGDNKSQVKIYYATVK